jgi:hypothetical protein
VNIARIVLAHSDGLLDDVLEKLIGSKELPELFIFQVGVFVLTEVALKFVSGQPFHDACSVEDVIAVQFQNFLVQTHLLAADAAREYFVVGLSPQSDLPPLWIHFHPRITAVSATVGAALYHPEYFAFALAVDALLDNCLFCFAVDPALRNLQLLSSRLLLLLLVLTKPHSVAQDRLEKGSLN